jgi:hypothetical protein
MMAMVATSLAGCTRAKDKKFARQVLDCLYLGSLAPIQDRLSPEMQNPQAASAIAAYGPVLGQQLGEVKDLKFKSEGPSEQPPLTEQVWTVTTTQGTFEMKMVFNQEKKLSGVWASHVTPGQP